MNELAPIRNFDLADEALLLATIDRWLERDVRPVVKEHDHADRWPAEIVEQMREFGLFGATVSPEYGGLGLPAVTYARIVMRISSVWMAITGIFNSHLMLALAIEKYGTPKQKQTWLPKLASGEIRGGLALTEPNAGTDLQGIRMTARRDGDSYVINGTKTWISNGIEGSCFALLVKTDPAAQPRYKGMSLFIAPKGPGFTVGKKLEKLGYKSIDSAEMIFEDYRDSGRSPDRRRGRTRFSAGDRRVGTRTHQRGRARRRNCRGRASACHRICADTPDLRQADRGTPGHPAQTGRDGDARPRRAAADHRRRGGIRPRRTLRPGGRHGQVFRLRGGAGEQHGRPCASMAPMDTRRNMTSNGSTAMRRSHASAKAPTRCNA